MPVEDSLSNIPPQAELADTFTNLLVSPSSPAPSNKPHIHIDHEGTLHQLSGNKTLYRKLLVAVSIRLATAATRIVALLATDTPSSRRTAEHLAYTIKNEAAQSGVITLKECAEQMEKAIRSHQENATLLDAFTKTCIAAIAAIRDTLPEEAASFRGAEKLLLAAQRAAEQTVILKQLTHYLENNSGQSLDYFVQHHSAIFAILGNYAEALEKAINAHDFPSALKQLRHSAQELNIEL